MAEKYTKKELWKLYKKIPEELKKAIFSEETAEDLDKIAQRHQIKEEKVEKIAERITHVFLGLLPPEEFQEVLIKEVNLDLETANKVTREINRYIFFPVKASLEKLYGKELISIVQPTKIAFREGEKPKEKSPEDIYREPIG